jgi:peroxiredoxin
MRKSKNTSDVASPPAARRKMRDVAGVLHSSTEYLIATRQAERALKAGNRAPSFRLPDHEGVEVASETLLRHGPMLLTFYTGLWFPACNRDLRAFESLRPSIEACGASLVGISQQTVAENAKAHAQLKLGFPILADRGGRVAQLFGVRWCIPELLRDIHMKCDINLPVLNGDQSWTLPIPSRFIVDRAGLIAFSEINPGQSSRSPPRDVLPVLDHLRSPHAA